MDWGVRFGGDHARFIFWSGLYDRDVGLQHAAVTTVGIGRYGLCPSAKCI